MNIGNKCNISLSMIGACLPTQESHTHTESQSQATVQIQYGKVQTNHVISLLLLRCIAGAPRTEHYQLVRALSAGAVVTVL